MSNKKIGIQNERRILCEQLGKLKVIELLLRGYYHSLNTRVPANVFGPDASWWSNHRDCPPEANKVRTLHFVVSAMFIHQGLHQQEWNI